MRLIDADALILQFNDWWYSQFGVEQNDVSLTIQEAMKAIEEAPTAETMGEVKEREFIVLYSRRSADNPQDKCDLCDHAIIGEIVRCKDCRFWKNEHLCLVMSRYGTMETKAEHYCSWGERREP